MAVLWGISIMPVSSGLNLIPSRLRAVWQNGTIPLGDRFCCENDLSSVLKRKEKVNLYDMGERNGTFASKQTLIDKST